MIPLYIFIIKYIYKKYMYIKNTPINIYKINSKIYISLSIFLHVFLHMYTI